MLMSKNFVESVLPNNLKQLLNNQNYDCENLKNIGEHLETNLAELKNELDQLRKAKLDKIEPDIKKSENFIAKINHLHTQISGIKQELYEQENLIKNVSQIEEYKNLIDHIEILNESINVVQFLHEFETDLNGLKSSINDRNFPNCYEILAKLSKIIKESNLFNKGPSNETSSTPKQHQDEIKEILDSDTGVFILKELKDDFKVERERLWYELDREWDTLVRVDINETNLVASSLKISKKIDQLKLDQLSQFSSLKLSQFNFDNKQVSFVFYNKLKQFSAQFLQLCLQAVINNSQLFEIRTDETDAEFHSIYFSSSVTLSNEKTAIEKLDIKLKQLELIIKFVYDNFFHLKVMVIESEGQKVRTETLVTLFSALTLKDFTNLIYEQLIINIIPVDQFDFSIEAKICEKIAWFEDQLKSIEFLRIESGEFKSFSSNVEELYVRKKCKHVMEKGRLMMKTRQLIFDLVRTETLQLTKLESTQDDDLVQQLFQINKTKKLKQSSLDELDLLAISDCAISKLAKQLVELAEETLDEAYKLMSKSRENLKNVSLMCLVARNLFELYINIIPVYYSTNLKELPQLSAIIYNDLLYLAYTCLTLFHRYKNLLSSLKTIKTKTLNIEFIDLEDLINNFSFVDLVPKLCSVGFRILREQVSKQEANLIEYLNENSNSIRCINEATNFEHLKKSIQKCVYQISSLSNVWSSVLNRDVYFKLIGFLFDLVCKDLLTSCLKLEDIENENSNYLHLAFSGLYQAILEIFSKDSYLPVDKTNVSEQSESIKSNTALADLNATKYVVSWNRYKYFLKILKANLVDIDDLWSDGKGPLCLYFEPEEIKGLVRALFMNTDRRSNVLAKIK